jgi:hypothetical protein
MKKKLAPVTEQFQHFVQQLQESFWGDVYDKSKQAVKELLEADSERHRQQYLMREPYERTGRCFRNQLLLIDLQLLLAKALAANFDLTGSCEAKFGYNLFLSKALDRSHQQLITEAPTRVSRSVGSNPH